jgi:hypothetical protein
VSTGSFPARRQARAGALIDRALGAAAAIVVLSMLVTALHDVSQAWDSGYYHLPFAARLVGILPPRAFVFHPANAARFEGFPLLGERLEGLLWRATGRPEGANLVSFGSLLLFALFLRRRFAVPLQLTTLALLAVPLVHTHAPSAYVDLPANIALSVTVLLTIQSFASPAPVTALTLAGAGASAAVAANMKALLHPIVALSLVALAARALLPRARDLPPQDARRRTLVTVCAIAVFLPLIFATPLANLAAHGNPYYPVRMSLLGHALPGTEDAYASSPPWLAGASRPLRFVCSLLEIGIRPLTDEHRWTVDQWMPDESGGNRMGGFFGAYVVLNVALLVWRALCDRSPESRAAGIGFAALTVAVSLMPQSHELRYYLSWMIVLVALNVWLASRPESRRIGARGVGVVAAVALGIVIGSTRGAYVLPLGSTFDALVRAKVDPRALAGVKDGERVCVRREPWNLVFSSVFHPPRTYVVVEAEELPDCAGARLLE